MLDYLKCILLGYLMGCVNPAAIVGKWKRVDLRKTGTRNLGASNTLLSVGKGWGVAVMLFDIAKAYLASKLARRIFSGMVFAGLLAGAFAVVGHVFPFYMRFRGGKGLAAFAGMVLAYDSQIFLLLLTVGTALMLLANYSAAMPMSAGILFPVMALLHGRSFPAFLIALGTSALVIFKHFENLKRGRRGEDIHIREFIRESIFHHT